MDNYTRAWTDSMADHSQSVVRRDRRRIGSRCCFAFRRYSPEMRSAVALSLAMLGVVSANLGCGSDSSESTEPKADAGTSNDANADAADTTSTESPCSALALEEPRVTTTYY